MYVLNERVQITNHTEPRCNGQYGEVVEVLLAYNGSAYYNVQLDDSRELCLCSDYELMEG